MKIKSKHESFPHLRHPFQILPALPRNPPVQQILVHEVGKEAGDSRTVCYQDPHQVNYDDGVDFLELIPVRKHLRNQVHLVVASHLVWTAEGVLLPKISERNPAKTLDGGFGVVVILLGRNAFQALLQAFLDEVLAIVALLLGLFFVELAEFLSLLCLLLLYVSQHLHVNASDT